MQNILSQLEKKITARKEKDYLRTLPTVDFSSTTQNLIDFSSNDYLGFARNTALKKAIEQEYKNLKGFNGSTGSRLISGNTPYCEALEQRIASVHQTQSALIFNSGYNANIGLFSCIAGTEDTILFDELCHASIRDGLRLSRGKTVAFQHNNLEDLQSKIKSTTGNIFIAVESVYSMDGDVAPLKEIAELVQEKENIALIVDEAHGIGVFGEKGQGLVHELELNEVVFAKIMTYGKAMGGHGAAVVGAKNLKTYLINYAGSFIYTTALPIHTLVGIKTGYDFLENPFFQNQLHQKINLFLDNLSAASKARFIESKSPIQSLILEGNSEIKAIANQFIENGFGVKAILSPTVSKGKERIRISLHGFNTEEEILELTNFINQHS